MGRVFRSPPPRGGVAMNFLLVAMIVLIWFLENHHSLLVHAP